MSCITAGDMAEILVMLGGDIVLIRSFVKFFFKLIHAKIGRIILILFLYNVLYLPIRTF